MGIVVCGNFAFFEIVAERGNGLCWATGGMEVGHLREEHAVWWVVLFSSEATLSSFVTPRDDAGALSVDLYFNKSLPRCQV